MSRKKRKQLRKANYFTLNANDTAPAVGDVVEHKDTIIVKKQDGDSVDVFYTDQNGNVLGSSTKGTSVESPTPSSDTLKDIFNREKGNITNKDIVFENEYPANLGYSLDKKYNYWWGTGYSQEKDSNPEYTGSWNTMIGANAGHTLKTGKRNTILGAANSRTLPEDASNNTLIGAYNFSPKSSTFAENNVLIGYHNLSNSKMSVGGWKNNVIVGGVNEVGRMGMDRIGLPSESMAKLIAGLDDYSKEIYGFKKEDNTIYAISNNVTIGFKNNCYAEDTPSRSIGSINIGSGNTKGLYRDYFNIYIGNHISSLFSRRGGAQSYDNIIIGNFISTWQDQGILAIHNSTDGITPVQDCLIYGSFRNRTLKINGSLTLNPSNAPVVNDTFNKIAVVNNNGDMSFLTLGQLKGLLEGVNAEPLSNS